MVAEAALVVAEAPVVVAESPVVVADDPVLETEDSSGGITVSMETPSFNQAPEAPVATAGFSSKVVVGSIASQPITTVSTLNPILRTNDIQIGTSRSSAPVVVIPVAPISEAQNSIVTPEVEAVSQAPNVVSDLNNATSGSKFDADVATAETVAASTDGLKLGGQTLAQLNAAKAEPAPISTTDNHFETYSAEFADNTALPSLSIILLATTVVEAQTMAILPAPLTLAVEFDNPDAADIIETYRAAGGEAVLLLPTDGPNFLGKGGDPANIPGQLDAILANSDGVIGILDGPEGKLNQDNRMLEGIYAKLTKTGHAMITVDGLGLNRASIMARESGIPATGISHVLGTTKGTIAVVRALDEVVLKLGDQRSVTVYARVTPDMLFGLNFWLESQKAQLVTVAPVSVSILRN